MNTINRVILCCLLLTSFQSIGGNKIKYYFTQPVNTSVSSGENAIYLNDKLGDTIVAYINRSKYTLDIAVYNYTSTFPAIAVAVNSAYNRGVKVRWIYNNSSSNTGIPLLNSAINTLESPPDAGDYSIMHNKFMIVDANSTDPSDAILWTGSSNWNTQQFNSDYNNAVVIQDQAIARAYLDHFNMMWGGTGLVPNSATSKFGQFKSDLGAHNFYVDGTRIEVYFSPADGVNDKIQNAMGTANTDMYFAMSTFTSASNASLLVSHHNSGVYVAGIADVPTSSSAPYPILSTGLGSNFKVYSGGNLYHHKYLLVDPSNTCSDPLILTGSHNWTTSADTKNDENTIIIHDATAANVFYQSFSADFASLGGSLTTIPDCRSDVANTNLGANSVSIFPNPSTGNFSVAYTLSSTQDIIIEVLDITGRRIVTPYVSKNESIGNHTHNIAVTSPGIYTVKWIANDAVITKAIVVAQ